MWHQGSEWWQSWCGTHVTSRLGGVGGIEWISLTTLMSHKFHISYSLSFYLQPSQLYLRNCHPFHPSLFDIYKDAQSTSSKCKKKCVRRNKGRRNVTMEDSHQLSFGRYRGSWDGGVVGDTEPNPNSILSHSVHPYAEDSIVGIEIQKKYSPQMTKYFQSAVKNEHLTIFTSIPPQNQMC